MENFQGILERVWIALKDCGPGQELQGHNLNLTAKEKLSEEDVQAYKHWLIDHSLERELELYFYLNSVNLSDKIIIRRKITIYFNLHKHDLKI